MSGSLPPLRPPPLSAFSDPADPPPRQSPPGPASNCNLLHHHNHLHHNHHLHLLLHQQQPPPSYTTRARRAAAARPAQRSATPARPAPSADPPSSSKPLFAPYAVLEAHALAATASRLSPDHLSPPEVALCDTSASVDALNCYLRVRNWICAVWLNHPKTYLSLALTFKLAARLNRPAIFIMSAIALAHAFLDRHRRINFGIVEPLPRNLISSTSIPIRAPKIIIVGAGIAGLAAAREILNTYAGLPHLPSPEITILEARRRIGGRIFAFPLHSCRHKASPPSAVDLGAHLVNGFADGNPLDVVVNKQTSIPIYPLYNSGECRLYDVDGTEIDAETDARAERFYNDVLALSCRTVIKNSNTKVLSANDIDLWKTSHLTQPPTKLPSLGQLLDHQTCHHPLYSRLLPEHLRIIHWHFANLEYGNGSLASDSSAYHFLQDAAREFGGPHAAIPGGLAQISHVYADGTGPDHLKLNVVLDQKVKSINMRPIDDRSPSALETTENSMCSVECTDGTVYTCDAVVMTVPLGVLKANKIEFIPPLPSWKQDSIQRLGMGVINKVILVFPYRFWDAETDYYGSLADPVTGDMRVLDSNTSPQDIETLRKNLTMQQYSAKRGRFFLFWNMTPFTKLPVMSALVSGQSAIDMESQSNETIVRDAMASLSCVFKTKAPLPWPVETIITRWSQDDYSHGSVSYIGKDATGADYDRMAANCFGKLFWAGEATCREYPGTVHGAVLSGLRVATDIANVLVGPVLPASDASYAAYHTQSGIVTTLESIEGGCGSPCHRNGCRDHVPASVSVFDHVGVRHHHVQRDRTQRVGAVVVSQSSTSLNGGHVQRQDRDDDDDDATTLKKSNAQSMQKRVRVNDAHGVHVHETAKSKRNKPANDDYDHGGSRNDSIGVMTDADESDTRIGHDEDHGDVGNTGDIDLLMTRDESVILPSEHVDRGAGSGSYRRHVRFAGEPTVAVIDDGDDRCGGGGGGGGDHGDFVVDDDDVNVNHVVDVGDGNVVNNPSASHSSLLQHGTDVRQECGGDVSVSVVKSLAQVVARNTVSVTESQPPVTQQPTTASTVTSTLSTTTTTTTDVLIKVDEDEPDFVIVSDSFDVFADERREAAEAFVRARGRPGDCVDAVLLQWWNELGKSTRVAYSAKAKKSEMGGGSNTKEVVVVAATSATASVASAPVSVGLPASIVPLVNDVHPPNSVPAPTHPAQPALKPHGSVVNATDTVAPSHPPRVQPSTGYDFFRNLYLKKAIHNNIIPPTTTDLPPHLDTNCRHRWYHILTNTQRDMYQQHAKRSVDAYEQLIDSYDGLLKRAEIDLGGLGRLGGDGGGVGRGQQVNPSIDVSMQQNQQQQQMQQPQQMQQQQMQPRMQQQSGPQPPMFPPTSYPYQQQSIPMPVASGNPAMSNPLYGSSVYDPSSSRGVNGVSVSGGDRGPHGLGSMNGWQTQMYYQQQQQQQVMSRQQMNAVSGSIPNMSCQATFTQPGMGSMPSVSNVYDPAWSSVALPGVSSSSSSSSAMLSPSPAGIGGHNNNNNNTGGMLGVSSAMSAPGRRSVLSNESNGTILNRTTPVTVPIGSTYPNEFRSAGMGRSTVASDGSFVRPPYDWNGQSVGHGGGTGAAMMNDPMLSQQGKPFGQSLGPQVPMGMSMMPPQNVSQSLQQQQPQQQQPMIPYTPMSGPASASSSVSASPVVPPNMMSSTPSSTPPSMMLGNMFQQTQMSSQVPPLQQSQRPMYDPSAKPMYPDSSHASVVVGGGGGANATPYWKNDFAQRATPPVIIPPDRQLNAGAAPPPPGYAYALVKLPVNGSESVGEADVVGHGNGARQQQQTALNPVEMASGIPPTSMDSYANYVNYMSMQQQQPQPQSQQMMPQQQQMQPGHTGIPINPRASWPDYAMTLHQQQQDQQLNTQAQSPSVSMPNHYYVPEPSQSQSGSLVVVNPLRGRRPPTG